MQQLNKAFDKISEDSCKIFGLPYNYNQILVVNDSGQQTLDGNYEYYYDPKYKFDKNDTGIIQDKFGGFKSVGREYGLHLNQVLIVPVKYRADDYAKCVGEAIPGAYNFSTPYEFCRALVIPCENSDFVLNCGVFSGFNAQMADHFAYTAGRAAVLNASEDKDFQDALRRALESCLGK
ncbi:MAG: hypothetical protein LBB23_01235 [Rickettsiales bacterium]|jgi:hypothetical protein|nr:hypothetical protein [Rickettsiales bacterium]